MKKYLTLSVVFLFFGLFGVALASEPVMIRDTNTRDITGGQYTGTYSYFIENNDIYFTTFDTINIIWTLYKFDPDTLSYTNLSDTIPANVSLIKNAGSKNFFVTGDSLPQLWVTDGTYNGTFF